MFRIAAILILLSATAANAVMISGDTDCGQWVKGRRTNGSDILEGYVTGALNGMAIAKQAEFWHAGGKSISRDAAFLWIDNYCQSHPLDGLMDAIFALFGKRTGLPIIPSE